MKRAALLSALVSIAACSDEGPCPAATLPPLDDLPAFTVVTTDYTSTAIALLDADGLLVDEAWVDSGSAEAGIVAALSGDVSLPSEPLAMGELTLLDRFGVDVISRFDLAAGRVIDQVDVQLPTDEGGGGFRSNPQDVVALPDGTFLVSRFTPNFDPDAPALDRGNDIVVVDSEGPVSRIAFDALDVVVDGTTAFARPGRIARLGGALVVGLGRFSDDFGALGPGAVAIVTLDPPSVRTLELPGLLNCPALRATPEGDAVIVLCAGPHTERTPTRRESVGLARIVDRGAGPELAEIWRAADHPEAPAPIWEPTPLGGTRVAVPSLDDAETADRLAIVDLATGETSIAHVAATTFSIGVGRHDESAGLLLVPDATEGVLRFRVTGSEVTPLGAVDPSPCRRLPPREIGRLLR